MELIPDRKILRAKEEQHDPKLAHVAGLGFFFFLLQVPQPPRPDGQVTVLTIPSKRYSSVHGCEKAAQLWNGIVIPSGTITTEPLYASDLHYAARRLDLKLSPEGVRFRVRLLEGDALVEGHTRRAWPALARRRMFPAPGGLPASWFAPLLP